MIWRWNWRRLGGRVFFFFLTCPPDTDNAVPPPAAGAGMNAIFGEPGALGLPDAFDGCADGGASWTAASPGGFTVIGLLVEGTGMMGIFGLTCVGAGGAGVGACAAWAAVAAT